mmetsp:Transcript_31079/g.59891  ORF Transcript_31079/g.59891 Transcript_31079/m.59891 type:complete len:495 (-) Transcript_31079:170-1654(-)
MSGDAGGLVPGSSFVAEATVGSHALLPNRTGTEPSHVALEYISTVLLQSNPSGHLAYAQSQSAPPLPSLSSLPPTELNILSDHAAGSSSFSGTSVSRQQLSTLSLPLPPPPPSQPQPIPVSWLQPAFATPPIFSETGENWLNSMSSPPPPPPLSPIPSKWLQRASAEPSLFSESQSTLSKPVPPPPPPLSPIPMEWNTSAGPEASIAESALNSPTAVPFPRDQSPPLPQPLQPFSQPLQPSPLPSTPISRVSPTMMRELVNPAPSLDQAPSKAAVLSSFAASAAVPLPTAKSGWVRQEHVEVALELQRTLEIPSSREMGATSVHAALTSLLPETQVVASYTAGLEAEVVFHIFGSCEETIDVLTRRLGGIATLSSDVELDLRLRRPPQCITRWVAPPQRPIESVPKEFGSQAPAASSSGRSAASMAVGLALLCSLLLVSRARHVARLSLSTEAGPNVLPLFHVEKPAKSRLNAVDFVSALLYALRSPKRGAGAA